MVLVLSKLDDGEVADAEKAVARDAVKRAAHTRAPHAVYTRQPRHNTDLADVPVHACAPVGVAVDLRGAPFVARCAVLVCLCLFCECGKPGGACG